MFNAFAHSHHAHVGVKHDVHIAAAELRALGRKAGKQKKQSEAAGAGGADEDWHAPQPPTFSSDEENVRQTIVFQAPPPETQKLGACRANGFL